jgi:hypothetical protein
MLIISYLINIKTIFIIKISAENFEGILKELGVNKLLRTMVKNVKPHVTISEKNGKWLFKSETTFRTTSYEFTPDVQFEDVAPDGQQMTVR